MGEIIMSASVITTIILCFVGIVKLPFNKLKTKHPKLYRGLFYVLSFILSIGLPILCGLFILNLSLKSLEFYVLIITVVAGVFGLYSSYEGVGLKALVHLVCRKIKEWCVKHSDNAVVKTINKTIKKIGLDKVKETIKQIETDTKTEVKEQEEEKKIIV